MTAESMTVLTVTVFAVKENGLALQARSQKTPLLLFYFPELGKFIPGPKKHSYSLIFPSFTLK